MSVRKLLALAAVVLAATIPLGARANVVIRLATQAPLNSTWHKALLDMGAEWETKTAGRVKLTVYPGGQQGSEEATIKMMRPGVDQLQGNLVMASGLSTIDESFNVFGMPFFFASDAEAMYVQEKLQPMFEQRLNAKGFKMLCWGSGGWVQLFSKQPIKTLADVKAAKMYTAQGDDRMVQWYKANGFHPVALSAGDIPAQLQTGMIDTSPMPPYLALVLQMFRQAKFMLDVKVGPLVGALVLTNEAWNKIDANDRTVVLAAAKTLQTRMLTEVPKQDADSVTTMQSRGLTVTAPDAAAAAAFRAEADKMVATMRGNMVPADIYDAAVRERDAFRKTRANVVIRLATQAPVNSTWHKALLDMGGEWETKTAGRVKLSVFAGGMQGSEEATVNKMMRPGVDQLQGNLLISSGLGPATIDDSFNVFGMPFFFANDAEATYVQEKLQSMLEARLAAKGFKMLCWGSGGWVQLFSKQPLKTLDDVKAAKMYTNQGDRMVQWYKSNGFHPVALSAGDISAQLSTGMIATAPSPPYIALVPQMKFMLDVRVGPLVGALVLTNDAWNKIDAADRTVLIQGAKTLQTRMMNEVPKQDAESVKTMVSKGLLTVTTLDEKTLAAFRTEADRMVATMRGNIVPADIYDPALRERDAFRKIKK